MKPIKALTLVLALTLLIAPILVATPGFSQNPVSFSAQPIAVPPLTDTNANPNILETPPGPSPIGQNFTVELHLLGATLANVPAGVAGVEVHFDFSSILAYAVPTGFTNMLGQPGGVLTGPQDDLLNAIKPAYFMADGVTKVTTPPYTGATQLILSSASANGPWNATDGLLVILKFMITAQPASGALDFIGSMPFTFASAVDGTAAAISTDVTTATLHIDAVGFVQPPRPIIFITPPAFTGIAPVGTLFNYTVMITADPYWDVAGFDITVNWNDSLIHLVAYSEGDFLLQGGATTYGFFNSNPGSLEAVFTRLNDTNSHGTGSLLQLEFSVAFVGTTFPAQTCLITLTNVDLASWAHPERKEAPWFNSITAVSLFPYPGATITGATYTAPIAILGAAIDLYDQYPDPFGGQGPYEHSDSFAPQQLVCLYAKVTFGGDRVTNKLVAFEIHDANGTKITILQNYTDINGIAKVCFRIPQTDMIPGGEDPSIFGWWNVTSTVELDQVTVSDTMAFQVGWLAQVTSVVAINAPYLKYTDVMNFTATVKTIHEQPIWVLVSIDSYDVMGYPIGETAFWVQINATRGTSPFTGPDTTTYGGVYVYSNIIQPIPTWARVGTATVVGYALTDWPRNGGTPYGPQSPTTSFGIILS